MLEKVGEEGVRKVNWRPIMGFIGALAQGLFRTIVGIR
jgi:hypothetical protein